jgi:DNA invertase Pin-like site-specific DNA recombinase
MLEYVREGDTLVVHSMDRLARNADDLSQIVKGLTSRGVQVEFRKEHLTFTGDDSPIAELMLRIMGALAQFERALLRERQREGIAIAKRNGVYKGRKPRLDAAKVAELRQRVATGEKKSVLARDFRLSRQALYGYLAKEKATDGAC